MATSVASLLDAQQLHNNVEKDRPTNNIVPSFSFSGCGFLGVYHVGVAVCLKNNTDVLSRQEIKFAGASAGALVAATLLLDIDFSEVTSMLLGVAKLVRERQNVDLSKLLRDMLVDILPADAHITVSNRLYISVTLLSGLNSGLITKFQSRDHLIDCLIATCFVPGFLGWIPPVLERRDFHNLGVFKESTLDTLDEAPETSSAATSCGESESDESDLSDDEQDQGESLLDFLQDDDERFFNLSSALPQESYLKSLIRFSYLGLRATSRMMRKLPFASSLMDRVTPKVLGGFDGLMEALVLEVMSERYAVVDGGFTDNIPHFNANTVSICPFAGEADICPRDLTGLDFNIDLGRTSMHWSEDNMYRLSKALNPMEPEMLKKLCEEGYNDCLKFLTSKDLHSCNQHLMTRAAISPSPCNVGHANCNCVKCESADIKIKRSLSCVECAKVKKKALESYLPEHVKDEFEKAIEEYNKQRGRAVWGWDKLIACLWWSCEIMFCGVVQMSDIAIDFHRWLLRFCDTLLSWVNFASLTMKNKRRKVRTLLSSLKNFILKAIEVRAKKGVPRLMVR